MGWQTHSIVVAQWPAARSRFNGEIDIRRRSAIIGVTAFFSTAASMVKVRSASRWGRFGVVFALGITATVGTGAITNFVNFETAPVHPMVLGPDGRTLAVCNLP